MAPIESRPLRKTSRTSARAERGQNLIEFALLMPLVLVFIAAIVVFGRALNTRSSLQQAVREGARQAAVGASLTNVRDLAAGNAPDTLVPSDVLVCLPAGSSGQVGESVRVSVSKDVTLVSVGGIFNALGGVSPLTVTMNPKATARLEHSISGLGAC